MKLSHENRIELYQFFITKMVEEGYSAFFIGEELALLCRAIDLAETPK